MRFHFGLGLLGEADPCVIDDGEQLHYWRFALPDHGPGKLDDRLHSVSHIPIPVVDVGPQIRGKISSDKISLMEINLKY